MSLAVYHPQSSEAQRELEMDPNLPLFRVLIRLAHGVGLPVDAVKKIRNEFLSWWWQVTLTGTRRLEDGYGLANYRGVYGEWAGTQRLVNRNYLMERFWAKSSPYLDATDNAYEEHLYCYPKGLKPTYD